MVTASPQPTVKLEPRSVNFTLQLSNTVAVFSCKGSQRQFKCDNSQVTTSNTSCKVSRTSNNLSADARGISAAEVSFVH
jgi:hypothetical protein